MKLKRFFPSLILLFLSLAILVAVPVILYFSSDYPKDPALKLSLNLKQGLGLAAAIILPLWLGAGLTALLNLIKDGRVRRLVSLGTYIGSFFICVLLPILGVFAVYGIFSIGEGWKRLPDPPETPVAIAAASRGSVVIETEGGSYYYCIVNNELCWQPENKPEDRLIGDEYDNQLTGNMPQIAPPGTAVDILGVTHRAAAAKYETHYAVLEDGTVWYLVREVNNFAGAFVAFFAAIFLLPVAGGSAIMLTGAGVVSASRWLADRIWPEPLAPPTATPEDPS